MVVDELSRHVNSLLAVFLTISSASWVAATLSSMSSQDPFNQYAKPSAGQDPCNPLYWYPKSVPGYCYKSKEVVPPPLLPPAPPFPPIPMPMPNPLQTVPIYASLMYSPVQQYVPPPPLMLPLTPQMPCGTPSFGMPSPSFGLPSPGFGMPSSCFGTPPAQPYYPPALPPPPQVGLVPGLPGLVSQDGGINILPFSDVYTDMLEKHKQKLIRKRLQKVLDEYDDYPYKKQKHRKY